MERLMPENRIQVIEQHVQQVMTNEVAHTFQHVDRVRCWAVQITQGEGFRHLEMVEAAALLHDIGLAYTPDRRQHAVVGADVAARFLTEQRLFEAGEIAEITYAIRHHSSLQSDRQLLRILRDADTLDLLGAVGLMRAFTSMAAKPEYDPHNIKGATWGITAQEVTERFAQGLGIGDYIIDQVNFQISCYANLNTATARKIAGPLVEFMRAYVIQLEAEINTGRNGRPYTKQANQ
jgi:putative nucleotidyltransferase with HDIG domain